MSEKTWSLYTITHKESGKIYVGISCDVKTRWKAHRIAAKNNTGWKIHKALNAHGIDAFDWKVIAIGMSQAYAKQIERHVIAALNAAGREKYNLTDGGDGSLNPSPETREKMSKASKGVPKSPQHIENVRQSKLGVPCKEETKEKLRQANLGKKASAEAKAAMSAGRAGKKLSPQHVENISKGNKGRIKSEQEIANMTAGQRARRLKEKLAKEATLANAVPPDLKKDK